MGRCDGCPGPRPCPGEDHRPICGYVAAGRREWLDHLIALSTGRPPPPDAGRIDPAAAMLADLCSSGAGPCGCGNGPPRLCGHRDRPAEVRRPACLQCAARGEWERGVDPAW